MSHTEALMMGVWARAAALSLVLQQLVLTVTAEGIGKYFSPSMPFRKTSRAHVKNLFNITIKEVCFTVFFIEVFLTNCCLVLQLPVCSKLQITRVILLIWMA